MDELLDKFLKDEVTPEQFDEGFAKLTEEDKTKVLASPELTKKLATANNQALEALKGVRKAKKIVEGEPRPDLAANLRKENVDKASKRFFDKYKVPAEEQQSYIDNLEQSHKDTVSEDLLFSGLSSTYAASHASELLSSKEELDRMHENGETFNADSAGSAGGTGDMNPDGKARNPKVLEYMREAAASGDPFPSYEAAERVITQGNKRVIG